MYLDPSVFISLAFLFGIAANFRAMDGYTFLSRLVSSLEPRLGALFAVVAVTSLFSPLILNDVVILILTPVIARHARRLQLDVAPLLVAEVTFTNISSTLTPFGNPQNLLLWQSSGVSAVGFVQGTWLPLLLSGAASALVLLLLTKGTDRAPGAPAPRSGRSAPAYLVVVAAAVFSLDALGVPVFLTLGVAFGLGLPFTAKSPRALAREFDYRSLLVLVVLIASVSVVAGAVQPLLAPYVAKAVQGDQPFSALFVGLTSNVISNVPATQLIIGTIQVPAQAAVRIAVEAGLAGNITPIGSFANILALMLVRREGLPVRKAVYIQLVVGAVSFLPAFI